MYTYEYILIYICIHVYIEVCMHASLGVFWLWLGLELAIPVKKIVYYSNIVTFLHLLLSPVCHCCCHCWVGYRGICFLWSPMFSSLTDTVKNSGWLGTASVCLFAFPLKYTNTNTIYLTAFVYSVCVRMLRLFVLLLWIF